MKKSILIAVTLAALLVAGSAFAAGTSSSQQSGQMGSSSGQMGQSGMSGSMMSAEQVHSFCQDLATKQNIEANRRTSFISDCQSLHDSRMGGSMGGDMEHGKSMKQPAKKGSGQMGGAGSSKQ